MLHSSCFLKAGKVYGRFVVESDFVDTKYVFAMAHRQGSYGTLHATNTHSTKTTKTYMVEDFVHSTTYGIDLVIVGLYDVYHTFQCKVETHIDLSPESVLWYAEKISLENNWWLFAKIAMYLVVTSALLTYLTLMVHFRLRVTGEVAVSNHDSKV